MESETAFIDKDITECIKWLFKFLKVLIILPIYSIKGYEETELGKKI